MESRKTRGWDNLTVLDSFVSCFVNVPIDSAAVPIVELDGLDGTTSVDVAHYLI